MEVERQKKILKQHLEIFGNFYQVFGQTSDEEVVQLLSSETY
jgi:predicted phosphoribosyltransferase